MIMNTRLTAAQMAAKAGCSKRTIHRLQRNMRCYNDTKAPVNRVGRRPSMTPRMLCKQLRAYPGMYQDEMARFVRKELGVKVSHASISRALESMCWSKKKTRQVAREQKADLQSYYIHKVSQFWSY